MKRCGVKGRESRIQRTRFVYLLQTFLFILLLLCITLSLKETNEEHGKGSKETRNEGKGK